MPKYELDYSKMVVLYDKIGKGYSIGRKTYPKIASNIFQHLNDAEPIVNIGAMVVGHA